MSSFEESIKSKALSSGKNDPAATDLDYYSKPENYTGSNLQSLQRFIVDKTKEDNANKKSDKKIVIKDAKYYFFNRYKHILQDAIFMDDLLDREREVASEEEDSDDELEGGVSNLAGNDSAKQAADTLVTITEEDEEEEQSRLKTKPTESERKSGISLRSTENISVSPTLGSADERGMSPDSSGFQTPSGGRKKMSVTPGSGGRQSTALQRAHMDKMSKEIRGRQLKATFQKSVKVIKCICRLSASARGKKTGGDASSMRTFMDIASDEATTEENMKNAGLSFDPTYFKAKKEISLSAETKSILTTPSERRTPDQVQTAMFGLQSLRSYAEYPLHMQEKLAKVAWYEVVAPKRIIIRQGHFAENFYFILSGHAVVTILLKDPKTGSSFVKIATVMKKGMSFGELALLHHSKRTATVTSQDTVQLLSIGREDFFDIFMASEGPDNIPEHIRFISNLDFMKDWPIEQLLENPQHCLLHFFKRNTTVVANSNNSEWMYIVKSGSCQVLKKLKGVTGKCEYTKPKVDDNLFSSPKMKAIVFAPIVDSGLRKRRKSPDTKDEHQSSESDEVDSGDAGADKHVKFSKDNYTKNPSTKRAHFSAKSSFDRRKDYEPPARCKPKLVEGPKEPEAPIKPGPVFVQVSTMKPRDVFGIDSIQFDDDVQLSHTSVSLISGGAELVMLSKEFYTKNANEMVKKRIRESVRPYPDEEVFQENLQIKEDWVMYKKVLLNDLTSQIKDLSNRFNS